MKTNARSWVWRPLQENVDLVMKNDLQAEFLCRKFIQNDMAGSVLGYFGEKRRNQKLARYSVWKLCVKKIDRVFLIKNKYTHRLYSITLMLIFALPVTQEDPGYRGVRVLNSSKGVGLLLL